MNTESLITSINFHSAQMAAYGTTQPGTLQRDQKEFPSLTRGCLQRGSLEWDEESIIGPSSPLCAFAVLIKKW